MPGHFCYFFSIVVEFMQYQRSNIVFQCINVCQVPRELLKTSAFGLGFQHPPRDLKNVNVWKTMFDPYIGIPVICVAFDVVFNSELNDSRKNYLFEKI